MTQVDGKALSVELRRQFPEVPLTVIEDIMHKNFSDQKLCLEALNSECQRYQENLYGVASCVGVTPERKHSNHAEGDEVGFQRSDGQANSRRHSPGSQGADHSEVYASSLIPEPYLHPERPSIHHSQFATYASPQFSVVSSSSPLPTDSNRNSQSTPTPPSNAAKQAVFGPPFVHSFSPRDQGLYGPYIPFLSGMPFRGDSPFDAFGNRPRAFNPHYSPFQAPLNFRSPFAGSSMYLQPVVNFPVSGTRSPIPFSLYQQSPNYYPEALHFGGNTSGEPASSKHQLNQTHAGSASIGTVGSSYQNRPDMMVGPQPQCSYPHGGLSQENLTADALIFSKGTPVFEMMPNSSHGQQSSCPGSTSSSRSGSLVGEELSYIQALVGYQKVRLDSFLADLDQQKGLLDRLRTEVGQLQKDSLERRLCKSDIFPTAADRQKLLTENQNLEMEISLLTYEIDLAQNGRGRLGCLDSEEERFHDAISTGQFNEPVQLNDATNTRPSYPPQSSSSIAGPSSTGVQASRPERPPRPPPPYVSLPQRNPVPFDSDEGENWSCSACTFLNHPLLNKCECCEMPKLPATPSVLR